MSTRPVLARSGPWVLAEKRTSVMTRQRRASARKHPSRIAPLPAVGLAVDIKATAGGKRRHFD